jgi:esterase/lipase superfamily enzyme
MIKVNYDIETTLVKGYYPDIINYASIPDPYIAITEEQHQIALGKQMCVVDGIFQEYIIPNNILLEQLKKEKKNELKFNRQTFQYSNFVFEENIYKGSESAQNKLVNKIQVILQSGNTFFSWNDAFDEVVVLELNKAKQLLAKIIEREDFAYAKYVEKLKEIEACATLKELNNININFT